MRSYKVDRYAISDAEYRSFARVLTYTKEIEYDKLQNFPWIKDVDHLKRINKYKKSVGQPQISFSPDEIMELAFNMRITYE